MRERTLQSVDKQLHAHSSRAIVFVSGTQHIRQVKQQGKLIGRLAKNFSVPRGSCSARGLFRSGESSLLKRFHLEQNKTTVPQEFPPLPPPSLTLPYVPL